MIPEFGFGLGLSKMAQNELLEASGLFTWTGTDSQGKIVRPGYYVLLVELYDLTGQVVTIRKTLVVATKLNFFICPSKNQKDKIVS